MIDLNFTGRGRAIAARLGVALACAFLLAGCGQKKMDVPDTVGMTLPEVDDDRMDTFRQALQDDGIPLSDKEMRALLSEGEVDRGLTPEEMREVQIYFKHFLHAGRPTVERFMLRSQPYMAHVRKVFRERGMPEELANLAFVESGFNPLAVSTSNAVGMWQFMAATGRQYGLTQDWWMDERRDAYRSTQAAAEYLGKLYGDFQNWHLAVAAYNAGEGKIGRALASTGSENFFELCRNNCQLDDKQQLKTETQEYVPRFLAMCKIMRNAESLGFHPADPALDPKAVSIPRLSPAVAVQARPGTDLAALARGLGMGWDEFEKYNPAFRRYITPPDRYVSIYVPQYSEEKAAALLRDGSLTGNGWATYVVQRGDNMAKVSKRTGVPVTVLRQINTKSEPLRAGTRLRIPGKAGASVVAEATSTGKKAPEAASRASAPVKASAPSKTSTPVAAPAKASSPAVTPAKTSPRITSVAQAPAKSSADSAKRSDKSAAPAKVTASKSHTVDSGDTLMSISRQYGISLASLRDANDHLDDPDSLSIGQKISLPSEVRVQTTSGKTQTVASRSATTERKPVKPAKASTYKVQPGDTMWSIARKFNIAPDDLLSLNKMSRNGGTLRPGDFIRVAGN